MFLNNDAERRTDAGRMKSERGTVAEYIIALKASEKFGPQVVAHRIVAATAATTDAA